MQPLRSRFRPFRFDCSNTLCVPAGYVEKAWRYSTYEQEEDLGSIYQTLIVLRQMIVGHRQIKFRTPVSFKKSQTKLSHLDRPQLL